MWKSNYCWGDIPPRRLIEFSPVHGPVLFQKKKKKSHTRRPEFCFVDHAKCSPFLLVCECRRHNIEFGISFLIFINYYYILAIARWNIANSFCDHSRWYTVRNRSLFAYNPMHGNNTGRDLSAATREQFLSLRDNSRLCSVGQRT